MEGVDGTLQGMDGAQLRRLRKENDAVVGSYSCQQLQPLKLYMNRQYALCKLPLVQHACVWLWGAAWMWWQDTILVPAAAQRRATALQQQQQDQQEDRQVADLWQQLEAVASSKTWETRALEAKSKAKEAQQQLKLLQEASGPDDLAQQLNDLRQQHHQKGS